MTASLSPKSPPSPGLEEISNPPVSTISSKPSIDISSQRHKCSLCNTWNSFQINNRIVAKKEPQKRWDKTMRFDWWSFWRLLIPRSDQAAAGRILSSSFTAIVLGSSGLFWCPQPWNTTLPFPTSYPLPCGESWRPQTLRLGFLRATESTLEQAARRASVHPFHIQSLLVLHREEPPTKPVFSLRVWTCSG